ncbi:MAG: hypothetical protein RL398_3078 [Planctomycetota bacterium]|jgi:RNA polymerase sigma-70 factor (ECF subfamily)
MELVATQTLELGALKERLAEIWERIGHPALRRMADGQHPFTGEALTVEQEYRDWVSTGLMDVFRSSGEAAVFALLFELNRSWFLQAIQSRLRRAGGRIDAQDVLQEVFLNIYRYPHRFHPDRADAFRGWGHRIARNTLLKFFKGQNRLAQFAEFDDEQVQPEDPRGRRPDRVAIEAESAVVVNHAYLLYLQLYLVHFATLSAKERRALTMVEVEGISYRDAAAELGIRLENLKMVIFRGRRKILRGMAESLASIAHTAAAEPEGRAAVARGTVCPKLVDRRRNSLPTCDRGASLN